MRMRTLPAVFVLVGMMSAGCHDAFAYQASVSQIVVSAPEPEGPIASPLIVEPIYPGATRPKPRGRVAGLVRDQQGRPIRLAQVWLRDAHPAKEASFTLNSGARGGPAGATSGLDGSFDIPSVPPGEYLLEVHAPGELGIGGFYPADTPPAANLIPVAEASVTHVIAALSSGASLEGAVSFDDGSAGIGMKVEVFAKRAHPLNDMPDWNTVATVYSDDVGRWRVAGLAYGEYVVSASMPDSLIRFTGFLMPKELASGTGSAAQLKMFYGGGFGVASAKKFTVNPPEHLVMEPLVIRPKTFHSVTAAIRSKDFDRPVNAGYAFINSKTTGFNAIAQINRTGVAQFDYVPAGDYTLTVRASDEGPPSQHYDADESPFPPPSPEPIRNYFEISVPVLMADHDVTLPAISTAVQWQKPGTTAASDENMVQAETGGAQIAIHVTTSAGSGTLARFSRVHLEPVPDLSPGAPRKRDFGAIAGLDGIVRFEHVPAGDYVLFAELGGFISSLNGLPMVQSFTFAAPVRDQLLLVLQHVQVDGSAQPKQQEITLKLQRGAVLTGRISFDDGAPAAGLSVDVLTQASKEPQRIGLDLGQTGSGQLQAAITDDQGMYRIAGLPAGTYSIRVLVPSGGINGSDDFLPPIMVHSGQTIPETTSMVATSVARPTIVNHRIAVSTWKTVTGHITVVSGSTPLNHAEVELTQEPCCSGASRRLAITGDGNFAIKNVPPGMYSLKARGWQPTPGRAGSPRTQTLEFLQTLTVAPTGKPPDLLIPLSPPANAQPAVK